MWQKRAIVLQHVLSYFFPISNENEHKIIDGHYTKKLLLLFEFAVIKRYKLWPNGIQLEKHRFENFPESNKMHMAKTESVNKTYALVRPAVFELAYARSRSVDLTKHWLSINVCARHSPNSNMISLPTKNLCPTDTTKWKVPSVCKEVPRDPYNPRRLKILKINTSARFSCHLSLNAPCVLCCMWVRRGCGGRQHNFDI